MKSLPAILLIVLAGFVIASSVKGRDPDAALPPGHCRITIEKIYETDSLIIKRLNIVANGATGLSAEQGTGDRSWTTLDTNDDGLQRGHVLLLAERGRNIDTHASLTWLVQVGNSPGSGAGGPSRYAIASDLTLKDCVQLELPAGDHAIGKRIGLGLVNGTPVSILVE